MFSWLGNGRLADSSKSQFVRLITVLPSRITLIVLVVHSRSQAVGMWQALLEEGAIAHGTNNCFRTNRFTHSMGLVSQEHYFKDKYLFYRFCGDENGTLVQPNIPVEPNDNDELLNAVILTLTQVGPDAMLRMILRKP